MENKRLPLTRESDHGGFRGQEQYGIPYVYFNRFAAPEKILQTYQHLFNYLELPLPAEIGTKFDACKALEQEIKPAVQGVPYIYGNTQYDCFELNSYLCSLGLVPQLIQSNKLSEANFADIESILAQTDPYICKAANIAPLQYVYDVLHPWFYMGHEFGERLRRRALPCCTATRQAKCWALNAAASCCRQW